MNKQIAASELPLQSDGSIYHLNLHPEELADNVILVGDPGRVEMISAMFDTVELRKQNRELINKLKQQLRESSIKGDALKRTIENLTKELEEKDLKAGFFDLMIDIAEEEYGVDIRKKCSPGQSKDTAK